MSENQNGQKSGIIDENSKDKDISTKIFLIEQSKNEITDELIYDKLIYSKQSLLFQITFSYKIIQIYLNDCEIQNKLTVQNRIRMRNISYLYKLMNNNNQLKAKMKNKEERQKIISQFFISFIKNVYILVSKTKKEKNIKNIMKMKYLNKFMKIILKIIGISYLSGLLNDDYFELLSKNILNYSLSFGYKKKGIETENIENGLTNIMFFNGVIQLIKIVFNIEFNLILFYSK